MTIKQLVIITMLLTLFGLSFTTQSGAEEAVSAKSYSGDFWSRSTLSGDWGGTRNDLAKKGVTFDLNLTQIGQGNISGGKDVGWEYGGRGDLTINLDTQKMGLWPGGHITVEVEGNFGNSVNPLTGAVMPVNTNQVFPMAGRDELNIPNVSIMQFLSHYIGVVVGKLATLTSHAGDMNEFAHGKGDTQFFNLAFNANPTVLVTVPYSTLAAGVMILPTKNPAEAIITINALDANGLANRSGFDTVLKGNTTYSIEGRVRTDFFGMTGHQLMGATYSARNFTSLDQRFIIDDHEIEQKDNSWSFHYNFDQYLYELKKGQGIGIFGRFGASDGNPNPVHYFYSIGVGGKGVISGRPLDQFGIGYYYMDVTSPKFTGPLATREVPLQSGQGFEAYYNFAITPWMKLTPDIQLVKAAQKDKLVSIIPLAKQSRDTATVVGLRLQLVF